MSRRTRDSGAVGSGGQRLSDPAREALWDLGWGFAAIAFVALLTGWRASELDEALHSATPREAPPPELARLSDAELAERGRRLDALIEGWRRLEGAMSFAPVLAHVSRAIPAGERIDELALVSAYEPQGRWSVRVVAGDAARALAWLGAEPYLARTFPEAGTRTAGGRAAAELGRPGAP